MKLLKTVLFFFISITIVHAQGPVSGAVAEARPVAPFPHILDEPAFYYWVLFAALMLFIIYALVHSLNVLSKALNKNEIPEAVAVEKVKRKTAWSKLIEALTRSVPVEQEKDVLLDHNYDGIMELDNKLPPWWVWGFYLTIVFAFVYIVYYHMSGVGKLSIAEYTEEMDKAAFEKAERIRLDAEYVTDANVIRLTDAAVVKEGAATFQKNCLACHGDKGQGNVGPNLTDQYWLHGGGIKNIFHTITEGVPSKGMISWKAQLSPKQIQQVASFVMTLAGTKPQGAKDPQGDLYTESADTAQVSVAKMNITKTDSIKARPL
jgi:cytochrome c oxidase cbb3-type subunit 3